MEVVHSTEDAAAPFLAPVASHRVIDDWHLHIHWHRDIRSLCIEKKAQEPYLRSTMIVPSECYDCDSAIASSMAILLHCECCLVFCVPCALRQMSLSDQTYHSSISCPKCGGAPSENSHRCHPQTRLRSLELAESAENFAISSAFRWIGIIDYQRNSFDDKVWLNPSCISIICNLKCWNDDNSLIQHLSIDSASVNHLWDPLLPLLVDTLKVVACIAELAAAFSHFEKVWYDLLDNHIWWPINFSDFWTRYLHIRTSSQNLNPSVFWQILGIQ